MSPTPASEQNVPREVLHLERAAESVPGISAVAMPPMANGTKQPGSTLLFAIEWFYADASQDMGMFLKAVDDAAVNIETSMDLNLEAFR